MRPQSQPRSSLAGIRGLVRGEFNGLVIALSIVAMWSASIALGLAGINPGAGEPLADGVWVLVSTFLSTGMFITAHECMHGLVVPGRPGVNRALGWLATWSYAGMDYGALERAHHRHHAVPATEDDPDFHRGKPGVLFWYVDFMFQYFTLRQYLWLNLVVGVMIFGLALPVERVLIFWALPLVLSTFQLFAVGTWLPHRPGTYRGDGPLRARSLEWSPMWSFVACYHFGYHFEHHARPDLPWWRLWRVRQMSESELAAYRPHRASAGAIERPSLGQ